MDLNRIKAIVNGGNPYWEFLLLEEIAKDEDAIPNMLSILNTERQQKKEILTEMNLLLSQAETGLQTPKLNEGGFIGKKIIDFYKQYKGTKGVFHCFCSDIDKR